MNNSTDQMNKLIEQLPLDFHMSRMVYKSTVIITFLLIMIYFALNVVNTLDIHAPVGIPDIRADIQPYFLVVAFALIALSFTKATITRRYNFLTIERDKVTRHHGFMTQDSHTMFFNQIAGTDIVQSVDARLFGIGDLIIRSTGTDSMIFPSIESTQNAILIINKLIEYHNSQLKT